MKQQVTGEMKLSIYESAIVIPIKNRQSAEKLILEQQTAKYPYEIEVKQKRPKRSLSANAYCWALIQKIAEEIRSSNEEVYIKMLERYGQREEELISVIADGAPMIYRATKNHCIEVGESELNGKYFKHFAILKGSSQYDTKQMSRLIDGIVGDAKELGIETATPEELLRMKGEWK